MEVWKITNGDNEKNNSIEPITKDDIVREYQVMVDNNLDCKQMMNITELKNY